MQEVGRKYLFFVSAPMSLGATLAVRRLIQMGHTSTRFKPLKLFVGGMLGFYPGLFMGQREAFRQTIAKVPNGFNATLFRELKTLTDEEKIQYFKISRENQHKKQFLFPHQVFPEKFIDSPDVVPDGPPSFQGGGGGRSYLPPSPSTYSQPGMPTESSEQSSQDTGASDQQRFSYKAQREKWHQGESTSETPATPQYGEFTRGDSYTEPSPPSSGRGPKNKYGDEME
ncbi:hypothetical protein MAR_030446 [Mya arenaria]|uniref:OCIA domain-containing protein n=2 Tax=Mya arenaria TaxID=6604 RepID=A0ABY7F479_MYAAR|nr:uncharacterized protein LOC128204206 isoform X2 [Mya arenaria]WAR15852.1 hypothetical protein MAR_030446 [Mya arenaria]